VATRLWDSDSSRTIHGTRAGDAAARYLSAVVLPAPEAYGHAPTTIVAVEPDDLLLVYRCVMNDPTRKRVWKAIAAVVPPRLGTHTTRASEIRQHAVEILVAVEYERRDGGLSRPPLSGSAGTHAEIGHQLDLIRLEGRRTSIRLVVAAGRPGPRVL
jgi:hypothetical protein